MSCIAVAVAVHYQSGGSTSITTNDENTSLVAAFPPHALNTTICHFFIPFQWMAFIPSSYLLLHHIQLQVSWSLEARLSPACEGPLYWLHEHI